MKITKKEIETGKQDVAEKRGIKPEHLEYVDAMDCTMLERGKYLLLYNVLDVASQHYKSTFTSILIKKRFSNLNIVLLIMIVTTILIGSALILSDRVASEPIVEETPQLNIKEVNVRKIGCDGKPLIWGKPMKKSMKRQTMKGIRHATT